MKKRGIRKLLLTIACVMLFAIAGGRQVFAQGESLTLQEIEKIHRKLKKMQNYYTCIQLFSCTNKKYRL